MSTRLGALWCVGLIIAAGCGKKDTGAKDAGLDQAPVLLDLAGADLAGADLAGSDLPAPDLASAPDLADADLAGADLLVVNDFANQDLVPISDDLLGVVAGPVAVRFYVTDVDGNPLAGVTVSVVGDAATAVSDNNGTGSVTVQSGAPRVLRFHRASYSEQTVRLEPPVNARNALVRTSLALRESAVTLTATSNNTISGRNGVRLVLPANSLVDPDGVAVTGAVELTATPIDISTSALRAFPGRFEGTPAGGGTSPIASLGTVELVFSQNGKRLNLGSGKTATLDIPIFVKKTIAGTAIAANQDIPLWSLDEATGRWTQEGTGKVTAAVASPTGFVLRATVSHFSWWNCDVVPQKWFAYVQPTYPSDYIPLADFCAQLTGEASLSLGGPRTQTFQDICGQGRRGPFTIPSPGGADAVLTYCALVVPSATPLAQPSVACGSVTMSAPEGAAVDVDIPLTIETLFYVPVIVQDPTDQTANAGGTATFSVGAVSRQAPNDTGLAYQWFRDGHALPGATSKTYTTPVLSSADYGARYSVRVGSSWWGSESRSAIVRVNDPAKDRWVDGTTGMDSYPGTQAMPFKTISRALSDQPAGSTVWVADGVYGGTSEGGNPLVDLVIPAGVTLRATNPGNVVWGDGSTDKYRRLANTTASTGDATVIGIVCHQPTCFAWGLDSLGQGKGKVKMTGVSFRRVTSGGASTMMFIDGLADVTMEPGGVANYCDPAGDKISSWIRASSNAGGVSRLTINGGACDGFGVAGESDNLLTVDDSVITLNGVLLRGGPTRQLYGGGAVNEGGFIALIGGGVQLTLNGTTIEATSGALHNTGIWVRGTLPANRVVMNGGALRGFKTDTKNRDITGASVVLYERGPAQVVLSGVTLENNDTGVLVYDQMPANPPGNYEVVLNDALVQNNAYGGVRMSLIDATPLALGVTVTGGTFSGNGTSNSAGAITLTGSIYPFHVMLRGVTFVDNTDHAISVEGSAASVYDIGTLASPGGNVFLSTGAQSTHLYSKANAAVTIQAVGNTWAASTQGADAAGHYSAVGAGGVLDITGPSSGANYNLVTTGTKLRLAENP